jgi:oligopeptide transport system substrate-binding protein
MRTLNPATASDYAYVLGLGIVGAGDYNAGTVEDPATVGVRVIDDYTLEMDFLSPAAYNPSIAGLWVAAAQPQWIIEGDDCTDPRGDKWTETGFQQSYGPYTLKEWIHDTTLTIVKNPFFPGWDAIPQGKIDEFVFHMLDENAAFAEYEAGNMDTTAVPSTELERVKADPTLSAEYVQAGVMCTYYYGYNTQAEHTSDVRVRRALSMAIDRQSLVDNVLKGGQIPAQWFSRPGLTAAPQPEDYPDLGIKYDPEAAVAELQSYLDEKGLTVDQLNLTLMFNTSSGHQIIAEAIQQMWADTLGLNVQLTNQEWAVYLQTLQTPEAVPQIWRLGWCMDYADANNFIKEVFVYGGHENPTTGGGTNWGEVPEFTEVLTQAATEQDPAARTELYAQAEEMLVDEYAVIAPIYFYTRNTVAKPYLSRTFGAGGQEALEKWDVSQ